MRFFKSLKENVVEKEPKNAPERVNLTLSEAQWLQERAEIEFTHKSGIMRKALAMYKKSVECQELKK